MILFSLSGKQVGRIHCHLSGPVPA